ncbi:hypothetical protein C8J56DRAFT_937265 [Mycena floridula]|nr:hypothetical protein C8J56DRAFT_937265 [Mycena floridula]
MEICFQRHLRRAYPCFLFLLIFLLFPRLLLVFGKHSIALLNRRGQSALLHVLVKSRSFILINIQHSASQNWAHLLSAAIDILLFYVRSFLIREALTYGALNCSSTFVSPVYVMVT